MTPQGRATYRRILFAILWAAVILELIGLIWNLDGFNAVGWTVFTSTSLLILWSYSNEHARRIAQLEQAADRMSRDLLDIVVNLSDSAKRHDPEYRAADDRRKANIKAERELGIR